MCVSLQQTCQESHCCVTGCQPCPSSNFTNDCDLCTVEGCQVNCQSCLATNTPANRTGFPPTNLTIPAGGCEVFNYHSQLICIPGTEGACPIGQHSACQQVLASAHCVSLSMHCKEVQGIGLDCPAACHHPKLGTRVVLACLMPAASWCLHTTVQSLTVVSRLCTYTRDDLTMPPEHAELQVRMIASACPTATEHSGDCQ